MQVSLSNTSIQAAVAHSASNAVRSTLNKIAQAIPQSVIRTVLEFAERPIITTNFRPGAAALLHMLVREHPSIPVVWVDTGFNTAATYRHVERLAKAWNLNLNVYTASTYNARDYFTDDIQNQTPPHPGEPNFDAFVEAIKLEPFRRAFEQLKPDFWFTGIRREQTEYRRSLDIVSSGPNGSLRVAPLLDWRETDIADYYAHHRIIEDHDYFDPTKPNEHTECGIQLQPNN